LLINTPLANSSLSHSTTHSLQLQFFGLHFWNSGKKVLGVDFSRHVVSDITMKFGKRLKQQVQETLPDWRDKFLSYKELKKLVRLISSAPPFLNGSSEYGKSEAEFVRLLDCEIDKFNAFFMEQEEDFIIRHEVSSSFFTSFSSSCFLSNWSTREDIKLDIQASFGG